MPTGSRTFLSRAFNCHMMWDGTTFSHSNISSSKNSAFTSLSLIRRRFSKIHLRALELRGVSVDDAGKLTLIDSGPKRTPCSGFDYPRRA